MLPDLFEQITQVLEAPLFRFAGITITLWILVYLVVVSVGLVYLTKVLQRWMVNKVLARTGMDIGNREATGVIFRYIVLVIGFIIILQTSGIDLTILNILAGTLGIGVGFGLQNIVNNFVSGLIILIERPIKVGDRIEVGNVHG